MPNSAPRAWQVVLERIESDLRDGRLAPGDRLTPERELATQLGVGRSSVREAVRVLEVLGVVRTATGSGPTAGAMIVTTPRGGLAAFLRLQVAANGFPLTDVVRTRIVLECDVAERMGLGVGRFDKPLHGIEIAPAHRRRVGGLCGFQRTRLGTTARSGRPAQHRQPQQEHRPNQCTHRIPP